MDAIPDPTAMRGFGQFIAEMEDGDLHAELTARMKTLVEAMKEDGAEVEAKAEIAVRMPKPKRGRSIFWTTQDSHLTRRNPRQRDLPFRDVNTPATRDIA
jgi:hypothetical protein